MSTGDHSAEMKELHYDVALMGVWYGCNYGSIATYYALNQILKGMGHSVLMIDKPSISKEGTDVEMQMTHSRVFATQHYNISKSYPLSQLRELNEICDTFIVGSDQLWNYSISKNFGKSYYLDYVQPGKKKIAYATSFGHEIDFAPSEERKRISALMKEFDAISVRESDGVRLCRDIYGIRAEQVLDPVFLADRSIFDDLTEQSQHIEQGRYVAAYILDPTPEKVELIQNVAHRLGCRLVNVLDGPPWLFRKNQEKLSLDAVENVHEEEWLYIIRHCEFLITDSCHGASFGLLYNKRIIALTNSRRGVSRFRSLAGLFHIEDRILVNPLDGINNNHLLEEMDYSVINEMLRKEKDRCNKWLQDALTLPKEQLPPVALAAKAVTSILKRKSCMGCGACVSACPKDALTLKPDSYGYYRSTIDYDACVNCGLCAKVCPALSLPERCNAAEPECHAFIAKDPDLLYHSSSGGIFPLLAENTLHNGGVVAGCAWREDLTAAHILIDNQAGLAQLKNSKYFQSYMGDVDRQIRKELDKGRQVLFSGCPCQVAGLRKYLGKEYENLILVDLLCANAPSAAFFRKYLEESFPQGVRSYQFRYKKQGWNADCFTLTLTLTDGTVIERRDSKQDIYQKAYRSHLMCPYHCEHCQYQSAPRYGDLTIGDFWGYSKRDPSVNTKNGISAVLINNEKGRQFFSQIPKAAIEVDKVVPFQWLGGNGFALPGWHNWKSPAADAFYQLINGHSFTDSVELALNPAPDDSPAPGRAMEGFQPLQFDSASSHFQYDPEFWEEHCIDGKPALLSRKEKPASGKFAVLLMREHLKKEAQYTIRIRFRANTGSSVINLHLVDSSSPKERQQIIRSCSNEGGFHNLWVEETISVTVRDGVYDGFGIGAAQFTGPNAYFMLDYILIMETDRKSAAAQTQRILLLNQELQLERQKRTTAEQELHSIQNSRSYQTTMKLVRPLRKVKRKLQQMSANNGSK